MKLNHGLHLGYCTDVHGGETWPEIFESLRSQTLVVRQRVCPDKPYGIGLRLGNRAAQELSSRPVLLEFQRWLIQNHCYVFGLNGCCFGPSQSRNVREQEFLPDWTSEERVNYTNRLFDLLPHLLPPGIEGSVTTLAGGSKEFISLPEEIEQVLANIWRCVEHAARVSEQTGRPMHLALEPAPLCLLESTGEVIHFFEHLRHQHPRDPHLEQHLRIAYNACHFSVEFEEPQNAIACLLQHGIKLSKIHFSAALRVLPTPERRAALALLADPAHLHQVVIRRADGECVIYRDLADALASEPACEPPEGESAPPDEWRIHYHIPFHSPPAASFDYTNEHLLGLLDLLQAQPGLCPQLEIETRSWDVLQPELQKRPVVDQLVAEYSWTLERLAERGLYLKS